MQQNELNSEIANKSTCEICHLKVAKVKWFLIIRTCLLITCSLTYRFKVHSWVT